MGGAVTESKVASHPRAVICLPTYNEAENLPLMVRAVHEVVPDVDILVIDDGSPDGTGRIADEIAAADKRVHVLHRKAKEGLGRAYIAGFRWALERDYEVAQSIIDSGLFSVFPPEVSPASPARSVDSVDAGDEPAQKRQAVGAPNVVNKRLPHLDAPPRPESTETM